jgi:hypothetical protein
VKVRVISWIAFRIAYAMQLSRWISERWQRDARFRIVLVVASALLLVALLYPFETTIVPQWTLRVIDEAGTPIREINVTEHWQNYLLESAGHEEVQITNPDGSVTFGARAIRASVLRRSFARITNLGKHSPEGRAVLYGAVVVWGSKSYETTVAVYQGGEVPQTEVRVQRAR